MSFFDLFKKKKKEQPTEELKWNKMWDLWAEEKASSPYAELMTYESEINNGGHMQFFDNVSNTSNLPQVISVLYTIYIHYSTPNNFKIKAILMNFPYSACLK